MIFILCTSSDNARTMFIPSLVKISRRVSELLSGHDFHIKIFKGT